MSKLAQFYKTVDSKKIFTVFSCHELGKIFFGVIARYINTSFFCDQIKSLQTEARGTPKNILQWMKNIENVRVSQK